MKAEIVSNEQFSNDQVNLMKRSVGKDLTDEEFELFLSVAKRRNLDPILRQIHAVARNTKNGRVMTIQTGIDGYRLIAARTGEYAGSDEPVFGPLKGKFPESATVTVYRIVQGQRVSFSATAYWEEYYPANSTQAFMWDRMPRGQLAKCAEALALRKGFPGELSGLHVEDEMHQSVSVKEVSRATVSIPQAISAHSNDESDVVKCDCGNTMMIDRMNKDQWYCNVKAGGCGAKKPRGAA